jgi:hypothetical protein
MPKKKETRVANYSKFIALWKQNLLNERLDQQTVEQSMKEIIIFGSHSAGVAGKDSDLDVFCIGQTRMKRRTPKFDLICMTAEECKSPIWLGSELGLHVAKYGVWLKGDAKWTGLTFVSPDAVARKRRRIAKLSENVVGAWERLHPIFQQKFCTTLRRELQRLDFLLKNLAVPPTPILDRDWTAGIFNYEILVESAQLRSGVDRLRGLISTGQSVL